MKALIWIATTGVVAVWSLIAWAAYAIIGAGGNIVAANADLIPAEPHVIEWASWLAGFGTGIGEWLVLGLWGVVSAVLLGMGFVATRFIPDRQPLLNRS